MDFKSVLFFFQIQWEVNKGNCSVCGDPWQGPHENIPPNGKYAQGIITRDFNEGDLIISKVQVTADHKGYFEFKLCPNNDVTKPVTQECLDKTVLRILNASRAEPTRYYTHGTDYTTYELHLQLPAGVYGEQVVLQWRYHTGMMTHLSDRCTLQMILLCYCPFTLLFNVTV